MQTGRCGVPFYACNRAIAARPDLSHRRMPVNENRAVRGTHMPPAAPGQR